MTDTSTLLTGSWPLRTHANRFYGTAKADGQHPPVGGLVGDQGQFGRISVVGYETSTSAVLSSLWLREAVPFLVAEGVEWKGPRNLRRKPEGYKQFSTQLANTKESHYIALPLSAHIREGILHPPDLPKPREADTPGEGARAAVWRADARPRAQP